MWGSAFETKRWSCSASRCVITSISSLSLLLSTRRKYTLPGIQLIHHRRNYCIYIRISLYMYTLYNQARCCRKATGGSRWIKRNTQQDLQLRTGEEGGWITHTRLLVGEGSSSYVYYIYIPQPRIAPNGVCHRTISDMNPRRLPSDARVRTRDQNSREEKKQGAPSGQTVIS